MSFCIFYLFNCNPVKYNLIQFNPLICVKLSSNSSLGQFLIRILLFIQVKWFPLFLSFYLSLQPDPWNTHVWKGVNGTPTKKRAIGFKKLAKWVGGRDVMLCVLVWSTKCMLIFTYMVHCSASEGQRSAMPHSPICCNYSP